jgi:predicted AAA+ superfamily ATPase
VNKALRERRERDLSQERWKRPAALEELRPPVIFDEIQNVPELFDYVRTLIDAKPRRMGQWLFTGAITNVRDLVTFRRFLSLLASRHGQVLNKTDLAAPLGVSVPTISEWLHILELYFFRDQQGLEVDFLIPRPNAGLWPVEAKASKTVRPAMAAPLLSLQRAIGDRAKRLILVHRKSDASVSTTAIAPGVEALDVGQLMTDLN